ncbi:hypothetical protein pb186bvf_006566 [Paramecium bursaria]
MYFLIKVFSQSEFSFILKYHQIKFQQFQEKYKYAFGVPIQLKYKNQSQYKTPLGGLFSLIIYSTSLAYALMVFIQWQSGQILPKSQSTTESVPQSDLQLEEGFLQLSLFNQSNNATNPFSNNKNILLPLLIKLINTEYQKPQPIFSQNISSHFGQGSFRQVIIMPELQISLLPIQAESDINQIQYFLILTRCEQSLIEGYGSCASDQEIDYYMNSLPPILDLTINIKKYNPQTLQYDVFTKIQYISFESIWTSYSQIQFQVTSLKINDGYLFDTSKDNIFINDYSITNQVVSTTYPQKLFGYQAYAMFFLRLDSLSINQQVVFPKLGEILAQIGSIVQLLLISRYLFLFINNYLYDQEIMDNMISIYYRGWNKLIVCRNVFGQITKVRQNDVILNTKSYVKLRNTIVYQIQTKLDVLNILHQIIKLEQCQFQLFDKEKLKNTLDNQIDFYQTKLMRDNILSSENNCQIMPLDEDKEQKSVISVSPNSPQSDQIELQILTLFDISQ